MLTQEGVTGNDIEENKKVCDTLDVKKDLFFEDELVIVLKGLKNNKDPEVGSVVNK